MKNHSARALNNNSEKGVALIAALLLLMLLSALAVAVVYTVNTEQHLQRTDLGNNLAYYGAESGMEKMMSDLDALYAANAAPTAAQINGITAVQPNLAGVNYPEYGVDVPMNGAVPLTRVQTISSGPNEGMIAQVNPLTLRITANRPGGEEVRLLRQVEVAMIPVFQFGVFSESDLSYFPGPNFNFEGRVHTNGNLFLASGGGSTVAFFNKVRSSRDVVRDKLANGEDVVAQGRTGNVLVPTKPNGCVPGAPTAASGTCLHLRLSPNPQYQSSIGGPTPANGGNGAANNAWLSISKTTYNSMIMSGSSGARPLTLPFAGQGVNPIEVIRRPPVGEAAGSAIGLARLYNQGQIRVLLVDDPAELPGLGANDPQNIRLANVANAAGGPDYTNGVPVLGAGGNAFFAEARSVPAVAGEVGWNTPPLAGAPAKLPATAPLITPTSWNLLDGWLRVEIVRPDGVWIPVTQEWLELGFARGIPSAANSTPTNALPNNVHPNAILIFQQLADRSGNGALAAPNEPAAAASWVGAASRNNWYPINIYDTREGELRENARVTTNCAIGGIMNLVEIDVNNLRRWLTGAIGVSGPQTDFLNENGYVLYFSDRRGMMPNAAGNKTGEYGFEDIINPTTANGLAFGALDAGEDSNGNTTLQTYGATNLGLGFNVPQVANANPPTNQPTTVVNCLDIARKNWVSGARHGVRLVHGELGNVPVRPDGNNGGFTLASENPAYISGNYNANAAGFGNPHSSSAVLADTVTLLSTGWRDLNSFTSPATTAGRLATTTWYRVAIASGKNINFRRPNLAGIPQDFGTDGGVHNFLQFLENWGGDTANYRGSMVSLYYSAYATGVFKCCGMVYNPPTRNYAFDTDFLDISRIPPGTPKFRDVVNVGFQQVF